MQLSRSEILFVLIISFFFISNCSSSQNSIQTPPDDQAVDQTPQMEDGAQTSDNAEAQLKQERLLRFVMD